MNRMHKACSFKEQLCLLFSLFFRTDVFSWNSTTGITNLLIYEDGYLSEIGRKIFKHLLSLKIEWLLVC